jgi:hypothetical protein
MQEFGAWDSFYVIVGSAAGALIGLQFVVMTLISDRPPPRAHEAAPAFATPTVVHFSTVLLLAAAVRAPWPSALAVAGLWVVVGSIGFAYTVLVAWRMRAQTAYAPQLEDWLCHALLPAVSYGLVVVGGTYAPTQLAAAAFAVAGAMLLLLFTAIHNVWDAISYHVFVLGRKSGD